jgi:hypothetical protein
MSTIPDAHVPNGDLGYRILRKYGRGIAGRRRARLVLHRRGWGSGVVPRRSPIVNAARYQFAIHLHVSSVWGRLGGGARPGASVLPAHHDASARVLAGRPGTHLRREYVTSWPRGAMGAGLPAIARSWPRQSTTPFPSATPSPLVFAPAGIRRPWSRGVHAPVRNAGDQGPSPPRSQPRRSADQYWHLRIGTGATSHPAQGRRSIPHQIRLPAAARHVGVRRLVDRSASPARAVAALRVRARIKEIRSALTPVAGVTMRRAVSVSPDAATTAAPERVRGGLFPQRRVERRSTEGAARVPLFAQPAMRSLATPPAASATIPAAPGPAVAAHTTSPLPPLLPPQIDVERLSDEVYRHIQRKVRIERERRGY